MEKLMGHTTSGKEIHFPPREAETKTWSDHEHYEASMLFSNLILKIYETLPQGWMALVEQYRPAEQFHVTEMCARAAEMYKAMGVKPLPLGWEEKELAKLAKSSEPAN